MKLEYRLLLVSLIAIAFATINPEAIQAARTRTRKPKAAAVQTTGARGITSSVRFRPDRRGLILNFSGFENVASIRYELVYQANGIAQGAGGTVSSDSNTNRELLFATCSGSVCTYHTKITNARLSIVSTLRNGTIVLKPYRIKP